jgi:hypothetical protein
MKCFICELCIIYNKTYKLFSLPEIYWAILSKLRVSRSLTQYRFLWKFFCIEFRQISMSDLVIQSKVCDINLMKQRF